MSGGELREVKHYLGIDLEATTDDGGDDERAVPRDEMETIEIGAVLVRANTLAVEAEFQTFVRPVRHSLHTPFCTELTGITQEMLADAPAFPEAMDALRVRSMRNVECCVTHHYAHPPILCDGESKGRYSLRIPCRTSIHYRVFVLTESFVV